MPEPTPNEQSGSPRRRALTPEQRRLLNTRRPPSPNESKSEPKPAETPSQDTPAPSRDISGEDELPAPPLNAPEEKSSPARMANVVEQAQAARAVEMRSAFVVFAVLVILATVFFAGRKFDAIKYHLTTRLNGPEISEKLKKFPGLSAEELIETALAAERRSDWQDATDRFLAAKVQNRGIPGILFRIGKSAYDRHDLVNADAAFAQSIRFGENQAASNYYRGIIATGRRDLVAATRFFEAAAAAEPFAAEFYYYWGEALRLDQHPREAIHRYEQSAQRTAYMNDAILANYKIRLARIEAVDGAKVRQELEEMRKAGALSVDWLMTEAALELKAGNISEAAGLINQAGEGGPPGLFTTCSGDAIFVQASATHREIAQAINPTPAPSP